MAQQCALSDIRPTHTYTATLDKLLDGFNAESSADLSSVSATGVTISSSDLHKGDLFIAVKGYHQHGAEYAPKAERMGACAVVTDNEGAKLIGDQLTIPVITVDDPRQIAGLVAARLYDHPAQKLNLAGVTGTNGKTTTSFMIRAMLSDSIEDVALSGTVETRIADQYTLSLATTAEAPVIQRLLATAVDKGLTMGVVESSSHAFELFRLKGVHYKVSAFTNLSPEHLDFHKTMEGYYNAKAKIMTDEYSDFGVICVDTEWGEKMAKEAPIPHVSVSVMEKKPADWQTTNIHIDSHNLVTRIDLKGPDGTTYQLTTPILGHFIAQDAVVAFVTALHMGVDADTAIKRLQTLKSVPGRMSLFGGIAKGLPLAINDFAHTPDAVEALLKEVRHFTNGKVHVVVASDGDRDASNRPRTGRVAAELADTVWVTDCNPRSERPEDIRAQIIEGIRQVRPDLHDVIEVKTWRIDAVREALLAADPGDAVVFIAKGAESYQDIHGVKHAYDEDSVIKEVLAVMEQHTK